MHGRGQGDDGPIITPHAKSPRQLAVAMRENMVFICKPSAISADGEYICQWGDTVVVTKNGGRRLGKRAHELAVTEVNSAVQARLKAPFLRRWARCGSE